jgi:hypothetical protein
MTELNEENFFLRRVAEVLMAHDGSKLHRFCIIVPSRQAGDWFLRHLRKLARRPGLTPLVITLPELFEDMSGLCRADSLESLFLLYEEYRKLTAAVEPFDRFRFWGEMILNDFDEIDRFNVDSRDLFTNVKRLREIATDYLTDGQRKAISFYWPSAARDLQPVSDKMWLHLYPDGDSSFKRLWEILYPLYKGFQNGLRKIGAATYGMFLRDALHRILSEGVSCLHFDRYVFVGFDVLATNEMAFMNILQSLDRADFYWKVNSPVFRNSDSHAAHYVRHFVDIFPSRYDLLEDEITTYPEIEIVGCASRAAQARIAAQCLAKWNVDTDDGCDTAIVLTDTAMLSPVVDSVSSAYLTSINIGVSLRDTPVANLLRCITRLHAHSRLNADGIPVFFRDDIRLLASGSLLQAVEPEGSRKLLAFVANSRSFAVNASEINESVPELSKLFVHLKDNDFDDIFKYLEEFVAFLAARCEGVDGAFRDRLYLDSLDRSLKRLKSSLSRYNIDIRETTALYMLERLTLRETVSLRGKKLEGVQIMGIGDTRALDFNNLAFLTMNEKVFPRRGGRKSFIPDVIRKSFGLPPSRTDENRAAYLFYSLIARARRVSIYYDTRKGRSGGDASRYILQLLYLANPDKLHFMRGSFKPESFTTDLISVSKKSPEIIEALNSYKLLDPSDPKARFLSASALNTYIGCQLKFYLENICGLYQEEFRENYVDSGMYGSIVHRAFEILYNDARGNRKSVTVDSALIDSWLDPSRRHIDKALEDAIRELYYNSDDLSKKEQRGETTMLMTVMRKIVKNVLIAERASTPFEFICAEKLVKHRWTLNNDISVNIKMFIDRIDRRNGRLVFVDYKTGDESLTFESVGELFDNSGKKRPKGIMQLMLYSSVFSQYRPSECGNGIEPQLYRLRSFSRPLLEPITYNGTPLTDSRSLIDEFNAEMSKVIAELFDLEVPFRQSATDKECKFCSFKQICNRNPRQY